MYNLSAVTGSIESWMGGYFPQQNFLSKFFLSTIVLTTQLFILGQTDKTKHFVYLDIYSYIRFIFSIRSDKNAQMSTKYCQKTNHPSTSRFFLSLSKIRNQSVRQKIYMARMISNNRIFSFAFIHHEPNSLSTKIHAEILIWD